MTQALLTGSSQSAGDGEGVHTNRQPLCQRGCAITQVYGVLWERGLCGKQLSLRQSLGGCVCVSGLGGSDRFQRKEDFQAEI